MEPVVLERLVEELAERTRGRRIDQIYALPRYDLALVLGESGAPRLWISVEPDEPHLYLRPGTHDVPERPAGFAMAVRKQARGRRVQELELLAGDRILQLRWTGGDSRLLVELMPRRASCYLLDESSRVLAVWGPKRGRPRVGEIWSAPARSLRTPVQSLADEEVRELRAAPDETSLRRALMRTVQGVGGLLAAEVACDVSRGADLLAALREHAQRFAEAPSRPVVYSLQPFERLRSFPPGRGLSLAPFELQHRATDPSRHFSSFEEAAAFYYELRARLRLLDATRAAVHRAAKHRGGRIRRARQRIERDLPKAGAAERLRQRGDLLLANVGVPARGDVVRPADIYSDGTEIAIAIDPALGLPENAERYYRRARRAERKLDKDRQRSAEIDAELLALAALQQAAEAADDARDCRDVLQRAGSLGLRVAEERLRQPEARGTVAQADPPERRGRRATARRSSPPGIARFASESGDEIWVGRSARANDRLTHEMAAREDWWLHAEGPGSHVVLRNPERRAEPAEPALRLAASVAAWYSKARGASSVEVHWTRVQEVRRPRGGAPGLALLGSHRSLRVRPVEPEAAALRRLHDD